MSEENNTIVWEGVEYDTIADAARANGLNYSNLTLWISKGYTCEDDRRIVEWEGKRYLTIADAARATGYEYQQLLNHINKGYTCEDDVQLPKIKTIWNNVTYESRLEAIQQTGIAYTTFYGYLARGFTCDADVARWKKNKRGYNRTRIERLLQAGELSGRQIAIVENVSASLVSRIKTALQEKQADG
jgi:hypothetical protein